MPTLVPYRNWVRDVEATPCKELTTPSFYTAGAQAELRFLTPWEPVFVRPVGTTVIFDCTTNDPGATVELFKSIFTKLTVQPGKLTRDGDIFTIVSSTAKDAGMYTCKAVNQAGVSKQQSAALVIHSGS